jgi:hypothetical protein
MLRFDTAMKSLAVRVLSDFGVDGVEPQALGSRKGRLALCVLALAERQVVPTDVLVDTLWGDAPPAQPEDQLAVLISRLRSVLGRDRIQHRDHGYLLVCDWLDASELAALTEEMDRRRGAGNVLGAAAAARVALSLLRGYTLPSVPGEWAQLRLAALDRLAGRTRQLAAAALFEAGDWMAAADAATVAVAADLTHQRPRQAGVDRLGTINPQPGPRVVRGSQPRYRTARTACVSHHASSSS